MNWTGASMGQSQGHGHMPALSTSLPIKGHCPSLPLQQLSHPSIP